MRSRVVCLARNNGGYAVKSQKVWLFPVSLLLMCGVFGCGGKKAAMEEAARKPAKEAVAAQIAQKECSQRLGLPVEITNSIGEKFTTC